MELDVPVVGKPAAGPIVQLTAGVVTTAQPATIPAGLPVRDTAVDLIIVGSGTGMATALAAAERGMQVLIVDQTGNRFTNEAADYMSFGQCVLERERSGNPVESRWIIFDQQYRNSYVFGAELYPRMRVPQTWYDGNIAHRSDDLPAHLLRGATHGSGREAYLGTKFLPAMRLSRWRSSTSGKRSLCFAGCRRSSSDRPRTRENGSSYSLPSSAAYSSPARAQPRH
jgi:FAD binding domain